MFGALSCILLISTITMTIILLMFGLFEKLYIIVLLLFIYRLLCLIDNYDKYCNEEEEDSCGRIPIVIMNFKEFKECYNLFPQYFSYTSHHNDNIDFLFLDECHKNIEKMFYYNSLTYSINRISFPSFIEWMKFYFWNKYRLYTEKQQQKYEELESKRKHKEHIKKTNKKQDEYAMKMLHQDLLKKIEKENTMANKEIEQGTNGIKKVIQNIGG